MTEDEKAAREQFISILKLKLNQYPEQRIGQLLCNAFGIEGIHYTGDRELTTELARYNP